MRSPIQTKWLDTSYGSWVRLSMRVIACSYSSISASWLEWKSTRWNSSGSAPIAFMKLSARSISAATCSYLRPTSEPSTKSVFQVCTWRRSAYPPVTKARTRFSVAADAW